MSTTLIPWGPRAADPFFFPFGARQAPRRGFVPAADVVRDGDDALVRLELPGVDVATDVTVEVVGHRLVVRGERRDEHTGDGVRETRRGEFRRSFALPRHVGPEAVTASYDAGVLTVRVAGVHTAPETHRIAVTGTAAEGTAPEDESPAA